MRFNERRSNLSCVGVGLRLAARVHRGLAEPNLLETLQQRLHWSVGGGGKWEI